MCSAPFDLNEPHYSVVHSRWGLLCMIISDYMLPWQHMLAANTVHQNTVLECLISTQFSAMSLSQAAFKVLVNISGVPTIVFF